MQKSAIFCKSFRDDFGLLPLMLESYERYCSNYKIILSVPSKDLAILKREVKLPHGCDAVADEDYVPSDALTLPGWLQQQVCKLNINRLFYAESFFLVDSDAYFISSPCEEDFFSEGLPKFFFGRVSSVMRQDNIELLNYVELANLPLGNERYRGRSGGNTIGLKQRLREFIAWSDTVKNPSYLERHSKITELFQSPKNICCQPGQIFHSKLLEEMQGFFTNLGMTTVDLIKLSPWEYDWYGHWVAATNFLNVKSSVSLSLHFPDAESVEFSYNRGLSENKFRKMFRTIQMAARHFDVRRYDDYSQVLHRVADTNSGEVVPFITNNKISSNLDEIGNLERIDQIYPFIGKSIFDCGYNNVDRYLALNHFRAKKWFSFDSTGSASPQDVLRKNPNILGEVIIGADKLSLAPNLIDKDFVTIYGDLSNLKAFPDTFHLAIAVNSFKHVSDLAGVLSSIAHVLIPEGYLVAIWGPIWSGQAGHHCDPVYDEKYDRWYSSDIGWPFDPWDHILLSPGEMYAKLVLDCSPETAGSIVHQIYTSSRINRYGYDDFKKVFALSGMRMIRFESEWIIEPPLAVKQALEALRPHRSEFSTNTVFAVLQKV